MNTRTTIDASDIHGCVAVFTSDGAVWPIYDGLLTRAENSALAAVVASEGRRRVRAGISDAVRVRERMAGDVVVGELKRAS